MNVIKDFVENIILQEHDFDNRSTFHKEEYDGHVDGTVNIIGNSSGIMRVAVIIDFNVDIVGDHHDGRVIRRFRDHSLAKDFVDELNKSLDAVPVIRFSEKFLDLNFDKIYTEFEEIIV